MEPDAPLIVLQRALLRINEAAAQVVLGRPERAAGLAQALQIMLEAAHAERVEFTDARVHDIRPHALLLRRR